MQCKDIDTAKVLAFIAEHGGIGCTLFRKQDGSPFDARSIWHVMPRGIPEKLAVAKLKMMKRAKLIDGCPCGCRGDWRLTPKGHRRLGLPTQEQVDCQFLVQEWREITPALADFWVGALAALSREDPSPAKA